MSLLAGLANRTSMTTAVESRQRCMNLVLLGRSRAGRDRKGTSLKLLVKDNTDN